MASVVDGQHVITFRYRCEPFVTKLAHSLTGRGRWQAVLLVILGAIATATWSRRLSGSIDLRYDASTYYILGTSLAEGRGYRLLNEPAKSRPSNTHRSSP